MNSDFLYSYQKILKEADREHMRRMLDFHNILWKETYGPSSKICNLCERPMNIPVMCINSGNRYYHYFTYKPYIKEYPWYHDEVYNICGPCVKQNFQKWQEFLSHPVRLMFCDKSDMKKLGEAIHRMVEKVHAASVAKL